jgi:hypothetical protein
MQAGLHSLRVHALGTAVHKQKKNKKIKKKKKKKMKGEESYIF